MVIKHLGKTVGSLLLICDLNSLDNGDFFIGGGVTNNLRSLRYSQKCTFQHFVAFLRKDGTEDEENLKERRH